MQPLLLRLVQRPAPTDVFSWDIQPSVLVSFCQAIVTVKFPYEQIFTKPGKAWLHNDVIMWQFDTDKFPGPSLSALGTGQSAYRWWHGCSEASLLGIFKSGRVFRTCNETVGAKASDTAYGFFGRAAYEVDDTVAAGWRFIPRINVAFLSAAPSIAFIQNLHHPVLFMKCRIYGTMS